MDGSDPRKKTDLVKLQKSMKKDGFCVLENFGFSEYYLLIPDRKASMLKSLSGDQLTADFNKMIEKKKVNRTMLARFIEKLAV
jgi:hypothetical protein